MAIKTNSQPAPQRQTVLTFATPSVADILFYETVDGQRIGTAVPEYGTPHPDSRRWPNHKLVFIQNDDDTGQLLRYYYAADREAQDAYNYELNAGAELTRTYVIPRSDYPTNLPPPAGGTPDDVFSSYGFVSDTLADVGQPLNGHYIAVQRKYEPIVRTESLYDPVLETNKTTTTTIKPFGYQLSDDDLESGNGTVYEVKFANQFHSLLIESEAGVGYPLQRQSVLTFVTPSVADILFYETVPSLGADIPEYGEPHPDPTNWPNHKLVYVDTEDSGKGHLQRWYYAADRDSQDDYNYELAEGQSLTRTYVIPRDDYPSAFLPPEGGEPDSVFSTYGFVEDALVDLGQPLNGLYVAVQRKYAPIVRTEYLYDEVLEKNKVTTTTLKPFGYELSDDSLVSGGGTVYEVRYVNKFHSILIESEAGVGYPLQRQSVLTFATPSISDILFYEVYDTVEEDIPAYGTAHPNTTKWPNHKLVFVQPEEGSKGHLQRYYYAANRSSQEAYNYELTEGLSLTRTYVIPRASYPSALPVPAGGTPDSVFTSYGFVSDSLLDVGQPLNGLYIVVQRKYEPIVRSEIQYDQNLEMNVVTTTTIKPFNYQLSGSEVSGPGVVYEVKYVNSYHSLLVENQTATNFGTTPYVEIDPVYSMTMYKLPNVLTSMTVYSVYAFAFSSDPPDYSEAIDFMGVPQVDETSDGPYVVYTRRFLTATPQAVVNLFSGSSRIPTPPEDGLVAALVAKWWYVPDRGVETVAIAREFPVPRALQGAVGVSGGGPGVVLYHNLGGGGNTVNGTWLIEAGTKEVGLNLYEVSVSFLIVTGN
jgi:hypothetical protein